MNVLKCMHNFCRPEILEILFEIVRSRNIIDICESSLVARADSNSCRDFECFLFSHKLSLFDEVELSLRSADRGRADCYPHTFSRLAVTFSPTIHSKTPAGVQRHVPFAGLFSISADCVLALTGHCSRKPMKTQYYHCCPWKQC
mgnify:CR=1 FL=1